MDQMTEEEKIQWKKKLKPYWEALRSEYSKFLTTLALLDFQMNEDLNPPIPLKFNFNKNGALMGIVPSHKEDRQQYCLGFDGYELDEVQTDEVLFSLDGVKNEVISDAVRTSMFKYKELSE